jgi:hypothetical protein
VRSASDERRENQQRAQNPAASHLHSVHP